MLDEIYKALKKEKDLETFYGNKKKTFVVSIKKISDTEWAGIVRKENKITGYWFWNKKFFMPIYVCIRERVKGHYKRYTQLPLCESIKKYILENK